MGASGSMQDRNRYNGMGSASGGALTDHYGKMMNFGGGVQMYPEEALGRFFSGNSMRLTPTQMRQMSNGGQPQSYDSAVRTRKDGAGGLANARVGINPPLRSDKGNRRTPWL